MAGHNTRSFRWHRKGSLFVMVATLGILTGWIVSSGAARKRPFGEEPRVAGASRLVSIQPLPEMDGEMCQLAPASATMALRAALAQSQGSGAGAGQAAAEPRPSDAAREAVAKRPPVRTMRDPHSGFSALAVDLIRNEVVLADENNFSIHVYDRLENTPPTAAMSEPKRMIRGEQTFLEFACAVYVDPATGDIYGLNNDTMNWMPVFDRNARGDVAPNRKLATPHTTFALVADEETQELFITIQDDHAVVVYKKTAKDEEGPVRVIQGARTQMADPHGITLDPEKGELFVSNWGTFNERPPLSSGGGGGFGARAGRTDWPVGRTRAFPASGKIQPPSITVYPKGAQGDAPPLRVIQGPRTQMNWPTSLAVHPDRNELFVANDTADSVLVFRADASGDAAPIRVLKGPKTMIKNPTGVTLDLENNELWVANFGSHSATVFPMDAQGDATPKRVIRSGPVEAPSPMMGNPHTLAFDTKRDEILVSN